MKVDNFEQIESLIKFETEDDFYFIQLIRRKKENPEQKHNCRIVKTYYVSSLEQLKGIEKEVKETCERTNARAYINLNVRSFKRVTQMCLKAFADRVYEENYVCPQNVFDSVVGQCSAAKDRKTWIVDVDSEETIVKEIVPCINLCCQPSVTKTVAIIPTVNGYHIITKPFNIETFKKFFPHIDIHKNNPTLLYYNNTTEITNEEKQKCCLCGKMFEKSKIYWGNSIWPLKSVYGGEYCCDDCNTTKVIPARLEQQNK